MNVIVLSGYGLNCEEETLFAFYEAGRHLGISVTGDIVHINDLMGNPSQLRKYNTMVIPGGFSYGDDTGAGNAYAHQLINGLQHHIHEFIERDTLLLGICNGCQILLRMLFQNVAIVGNSVGRYQCRWVTVKVCKHSVWLKGLGTLYIPVAHGEGRFYVAEDELECVDSAHTALRYVGQDGEYAFGKFPHNPNGSLRDIAALTCNGGRVLLMMPHPERALFFTQRYDWTDIAQERRSSGKPLEKYADGFEIFCNAVRYFSDKQ
ncbi:MAG: phosphoribosylformylglycinamidine synthase subunit PurQ [Aaplasma endosymbiont of Hyalomma asiaticum]